MLTYPLRVRDLVHGAVLLTEFENRVVDHPFFQRLRHIRQNDVAFYVYPSLNVSRFEHLLGACHVAGKMAENMTLSPKWGIYLRELKQDTGMTSNDDFVTIARLYALLHDIGHFPLSHLFEFALTNHAVSQGKSDKDIVKEWSGVEGFEKPHEAFGAVIAEQIVRDIHLPRPIRSTLLRLMTEKTIPVGDPLSLPKSLVDSEIDADRIDFVRRDGLLAGGEYGNYDINRLCASVFVEKDERGWLVAYSEKAITSMEALLLDRYRTYVWIHFHHRVVAIKTLVRFLISKAIEGGVIAKEQFNPVNVHEFALRDDVWLWHMLRNLDANKDEVLEMVKRAVFYREKRNVLSLWKNRPTYHALHNRVKERARVTDIDFGFRQIYEHDLQRRMGVQVLRFAVPFRPVSERIVPLYSERRKMLTGEHLYEESRLLLNLTEIWEAEPQQFILLVGENIAKERVRRERQWVDLTARWIRQ